MDWKEGGIENFWSITRILELNIWVKNNLDNRFVDNEKDCDVSVNFCEKCFARKLVAPSF